MARRSHLVVLVLAAAAAGCGHEAATRTALQPPETFSWCAQPISFSPPAPQWTREAEKSGGLLGVRFVLTGGGGQCITVAAFHIVSNSKVSAWIRSGTFGQHLGFFEFPDRFKGLVSR